MKSLLQKLIFSSVALLAACSSRFNHRLFALMPHPQEPKQRSYQVTEVSFANPLDGTVIAGELSYPSAGDNSCAIVLVSGHQSNAPPAERDYLITGHKYFLVLSDLLAKRGYTILRFDNRGVGKSTGDYKNATDLDFSSDAAVTLRWLRSNSDLSITRFGFLGHSQGGIKSLMAARVSKPDFIVSLAGVSIEIMAEALIRQNIEINRAMQVAESVTAQQTREYKDIFQIIKNATSREKVAEEIKKYVIDRGIFDQHEQQTLIDMFASNWYFNELYRDPIPLIKAFESPILALFGSKDLLVSAEVNEAATRHLLKHSQSEVFTFAGKNHLFQNAIDGTGPQEYWQIETTIEESVVDKIDLWLRSTNQCDFKTREIGSSL